jgi:cytochrome c oxidase subunit IV
VEFGSHGGPASKSLKPKFNLFIGRRLPTLGNGNATHWCMDIFFWLLFALFELSLCFSQSILCNSQLWCLVLCFLQIKTGIAATMFLMTFGGLLLIISSLLGPFLLVGTLLLQPSCIMNFVLRGHCDAYWSACLTIKFGLATPLSSQTSIKNRKLLLVCHLASFKRYGVFSYKCFGVSIPLAVKLLFFNVSPW